MRGQRYTAGSKSDSPNKNMASKNSFADAKEFFICLFNRLCRLRYLVESLEVFVMLFVVAAGVVFVV